MKEIVDFLRDLSVNNNREWFAANKPRYEACRHRFDAFVAELINEVGKFHPAIASLTPAMCTWRIYRDTRFSNDKTPYKTHMGAFLAPWGKKSGYSGYYIQIGPRDEGYPGGCMMATGNYYCEGAVLRILREDIDTDGGREFLDTLAHAEGGGFSLDMSDSLKRVPRGYDADHPLARYLKLKSFCLVNNPGVDFMLGAGLAKRAASAFMPTKPFLDFINRAIDYADGGDGEEAGA